MDDLLQAAGADLGTSLAALCGAAAARHFPAGPANDDSGAELVSLLGSHSQVVGGGRVVASVLLQRTRPAAFLTADQVTCSCSPAWCGLLPRSSHLMPVPARLLHDMLNQFNVINTSKPLPAALLFSSALDRRWFLTLIRLTEGGDIYKDQ